MNLDQLRYLPPHFRFDQILLGPTLPSVPVQPLLLASQPEYGMFEHFNRPPWLLPAYLYDDQDNLLAAIMEKVVEPAEAKARNQIRK